MGAFCDIEKRKKAVAEVDSGADAMEVAKKFGIARSTLYYWKYAIANEITPRVRLTDKPGASHLTVQQVAGKIASATQRVARLESLLAEHRKVLAANIKRLRDMVRAKEPKVTR